MGSLKPGEAPDARCCCGLRVPVFGRSFMDVEGRTGAGKRREKTLLERAALADRTGGGHRH